MNGKLYVAADGPPILGWLHQYDLNIVVNPWGTKQNRDLEYVLGWKNKVVDCLSRLPDKTAEECSFESEKVVAARIDATGLQRTCGYCTFTTLGFPDE
ncbi:hypothetical protein NDU88_003287 [Pleurodeles waltl]|uniref:Uncharacterized protein n=1 Tax=Pleurodeles waltl TaxID=8319 RepID=A0AAV7T4V6_PLEWA|nr:hypothetical protein NDU88_003287 [Pleurodeles waltl]